MTTQIQEIEIVLLSNTDYIVQMLQHLYFDTQWLDIEIEEEEGTPYLDIRLRYFEGDVSILYGDSQYDTDHRGYWGDGTMLLGMTRDDLKTLANELIESLLDSTQF